MRYQIKGELPRRPVPKDGGGETAGSEGLTAFPPEGMKLPEFAKFAIGVFTVLGFDFCY